MRALMAKGVGAIVNFLALFSPTFAAKIALRLFSSPRRKKFRVEEKDFLGTAFKEELKYEDLRVMTYRWLGKGETVLLAHGWESTSFRWKPLVEQLKKLKYNIVALDAPAHGNSSGKRFNALLYAECINLAAKRFKADIIVGHSVGGMAAAFFLYKYQMTSVKKLILLGAPSNFTGVFKRYANMMGYTNTVRKALDALILETFKQVPAHFNVAKFSSDFTSEGLLIHDTSDRIIPYEDALEYNSHYKKSRLITTEGLGHGLRTDEVNAHIIAFIND